MKNLLKEINKDFSSKSYKKGLIFGLCLTGLTTYVSYKRTKTKIAINDLGGFNWFSQQDPYLYNFILDEKKKEYKVWDILITYEEDGKLIKKLFSHKTPLGDVIIGIVMSGLWPISWRILNIMTGTAIISFIPVFKP